MMQSVSNMFRKGPHGSLLDDYFRVLLLRASYRVLLIPIDAPELQIVGWFCHTVSCGAFFAGSEICSATFVRLLKVLAKDCVIGKLSVCGCSQVLAYCVLRVTFLYRDTAIEGGVAARTTAAKAQKDNSFEEAFSLLSLHG